MASVGLKGAIAHGYYQADRLAMAAIEASDHKQALKMRQRINELESDLARKDAKIAALQAVHPSLNEAIFAALEDPKLRTYVAAK